MSDCLICGKTMKKGSMSVHQKRFHTEKREDFKEDIMEFNELMPLIRS